MASNLLKHVVFTSGSGRSHIHPGVKFCTRLVEKFPNVYISIYTFVSSVDTANAFLATQPEVPRNRMRIVSSVLESETKSPFDVISAIEKAFGPWILDQLSGLEIEAGGYVIAPPSHIIEDHYNGGVALASEHIHKLPIVAWWPSTAVSMIATIGNEGHGHGNRLTNSIRDALEKQQSGNEKSLEEIYYEVLLDRIVCIPGVPPFYEHEQTPQLLPRILPHIVQLQVRWENMRDHTDIVAISDIYEFAPIAVKACVDAFTQPVWPFCVGPGIELPPTPLTEPDSTIAFLDKAHTDLGPRSVIYVAFGTVFFPLPQSTRHMEIVIEEMVAQGLRVVLALSSPQAQLSGEFKEKMTKSENVIFPGWTNQPQVLEHPAIHYFMSHGGWSSTTEAIIRGVPIIFWPFTGDQPTNALQLTVKHDCGFELVQVRIGAAKTKAYPNTTIVGTDEAVRNEIRGIMEASKGEKGKQQRLNMQALGKVLRGSFEKGGSADVAMAELGKAMGL